jgi:hypothetical protein
MRRYYLVLLTLLIPLCAVAEPAEPASGFGVAVNSGLNGEVYPLRLIVTGLYYHGSSQFELGFGFHPSIRTDQTILSGDFNYKFYPNGITSKFNMYLLGTLSFINNARQTFYPTSYNYLFLNGGYGFEVIAIAGAYLDTNVSFGAFTYSKTSENPAESYLNAERMFEAFGMNISLQFNVGYRF